MNEYSLHLAHMGLGLAEELLEYYAESEKAWLYEDYDMNILKKEIGDVCWYLAGLRFIYLLDKPIALFEFQNDVEASVSDLEPVIRNIIGKLKKYYAYGKEFVIDELRQDIEKAFNAIQVDCQRYEFNFEEILAMNIEKLQQRFPDKYTDGAAISQADSNI